ncbi:terminase large subunit domain-containing protein, partial [Xanthomonas oryzae]
QIGATFYFAREALIDALTTGRNQIFLSASKAQAHLFRGYMQQFVRETIDETLSGGDSIVFPNGAELFFLGTNARTAQGYHGNFYFDEFFWTYGFNELNKVASGMAMHKKWRKTYFSTPSSMAHEAYTFWTGERRNKGKPAAQRIQIDVSHDALAGGRRCQDRAWRQIVNILDAQRRGCDLFDIDELSEEYSPDAFANLLMCEFVDDGASIFSLAMLQPCMVDSWVEWGQDYKPFAVRPYGDRAVWIGYDPAET